jgi:hypothetical protein
MHVSIHLSNARAHTPVRRRLGPLHARLNDCFDERDARRLDVDNTPGAPKQARELARLHVTRKVERRAICQRARHRVRELGRVRRREHDLRGRARAACQWVS